MNLRQPLIIAAVILFAGFATVTAYSAFGVLGLALLLLIGLMFATAVAITFRKGALVDEMEVGVIFNRFNNSFIRFAVSPDPDPSRQMARQPTTNWIPFGQRLYAINDPYVVRLRWFEEVRGTIPKKSLTAKATLSNLRTADGIPISVTWKVSYTINVNLITDKIRHKMARTLPEHSDKVITGKVERVIKHLVEQRTIQSLYGPGAIQDMEQEVCQRVNRQLTDPVNLGFQELKPKDISLGPVEVPTKVEKALELAHQRKIQTEMVAGALERLKLAIKEFTSDDIRHWTELERLRILDSKEAGLLYLSDGFVRSESLKVKQQLNGRSRRKI